MARGSICTGRACRAVMSVARSAGGSDDSVKSTLAVCQTSVTSCKWPGPQWKLRVTASRAWLAKAGAHDRRIGAGHTAPIIEVSNDGFRGFDLGYFGCIHGYVWS